FLRGMLILYHRLLERHLRLILERQITDVAQPHGALTTADVDVRGRLVRLAQRRVGRLARQRRRAIPLLRPRRRKVVHAGHLVGEHAVVIHLHLTVTWGVCLWSGTARRGVALGPTLDRAGRVL